MLLVLTRDVTMNECRWLLRDYRKGEKLERFTGATYGCISPDGIACREPSREEFFEIPRNAIKSEEQ